MSRVGNDPASDGDAQAGAAQVVKEEWQIIRKLPCSFPAEIFTQVMLNLIRNPNITSSHLFRGDVYFDREATDEVDQTKAIQHLQPAFRPRTTSLPGWTLERTIVRQLVPRNTQLDKHLVQTCQFFTKLDEGLEEHLVVYTPHVDTPDAVPFYHPKVAQLSFKHDWQDGLDPVAGSLTLAYRLFPDTELDERLQRTGLRLLDTIHKHGQGQLAGYEKRVHLDKIIPQKTYQDTYTNLKNKYGRHLVDNWVEVTDPGKHVFEDIGIAAFLIELWKVLYPDTFPGFVDIGCGNGLLTFLLISEGYSGFGFDARQRKTWSIFPENVRACLRQQLLVPEIFLSEAHEGYHNGMFQVGTFIVSNHADELTVWTPLLAYLNQSAFIAIPCCSYSLAGARFRAPPTVRSQKVTARLPQQEAETTAGQAAETGSLKRTLVQKKMASAFSTLCTYVESVAAAVGFEPEREVLRIPSTRNQSIIGRSSGSAPLELRRSVVCKLVEDELGQTLDQIAKEWIVRAEKLTQKPASGH
ncbi:hypothetical protein AMS68_006606 [Peltaster fructicola]|uniref:tRNA (uracil-O(2)-)-methyltransferase n=1 Tax=Peltaster fructicola TaxID=286661 RepID=A0A6H0Y2K7_9PEZI|nr:hypothetical protein AMS68_006606 [Peltaster fructicola]